MTIPSAISRFFKRSDPKYDAYVERYQARSIAGRIFFLLMHLLPGIIAYFLIRNLRTRLMSLTGLSGDTTEYLYVIVITFGWYIVLPFVLLKKADHLSFKQSLEFLGLDKIDWKGVLVVLPCSASLSSFTACRIWLTCIPG